MASPKPTQFESLKLFLAVASTGSFSRAAAMLNLTQSGVSKRILDLELKLGKRLFERTGRGVHLSEAGRLLMPHAEELTYAAENLGEVLATELLNPKGHVRLAVQPSAGWPLTGDVYRHLAENYPQVRLRVSEAPTHQIREWLSHGVVDLAVLSGSPSRNEVDLEPLFTTSLWFVSKAGDDLTRPSTISFRDAVRVPLFVAGPPSGGRMILEDEARKRRLSLTISMEVDSTHLIKKLA